MDGSTPTASNTEIHRIDDEKRSLDEKTDLEAGPRTLDTTIEKDESSRDPNIVDWDGPNDPENPLNWTKKQKISATVSIALITFLTLELSFIRILATQLTLFFKRPLGSSMFAPGVGQLVQDFGITSTELSSFVVSVYLLGYCFGPLLIAPISEMYGRRWVSRIAIELESQY